MQTSFTCARSSNLKQLNKRIALLNNIYLYKGFLVGFADFLYVALSLGFLVIILILPPPLSPPSPAEVVAIIAPCS